MTLSANERNYSGHHHFIQLQSALRTLGCRGDELKQLKCSGALEVVRIRQKRWVPYSHMILPPLLT